MKILLINIYHFINGGPERYFFNVKKLLEKNGNEVIPFSVYHERNKYSRYGKYFPQAIGGTAQTHYEHYKLNPRTLFQIIGRQIYSFEVKNKLKILIDCSQPDIAYILQIQNKLSPSVIIACKEAGIPVVYRLSDYHLICPRASFYNEKRKELCQRCLDGSRWNMVRDHCIKKSYSASLLKLIAIGLHNMLGVYKNVDVFVCTNDYMREKMIHAGYDARKLVVIPTFVNIPDQNGFMPKNKGYFIYYGRITEIKGITILIKAFAKLAKNEPNIRLKLIGDKNPSYNIESVIKMYASSIRERIDVLSSVQFAELSKNIKNSIAVVIPSLWKDNLPNTLLESFALGKPVLVPNIEPFIRFISKDRPEGIFFKYADPDDLSEKMSEILQNKSWSKQMGENGFESARTLYSPERHYSKLMGIFKKLLNNS